MASFNGRSMLLDQQPISSVFTDSCELAGAVYSMVTGFMSTGTLTGHL